MFIGKRDGQKPCTHRLILSVLIMVSCLPCVVPRAQASDERQQLLATVHVHSTASTGELTIEALAERAVWMR